MLSAFIFLANDFCFIISHSNPTLGVCLYLCFVILDFFIHVITHILIFLKYVRFVQIDLPSFLHLKPGSTSRMLSYLLTSTPSRHTLIAMANLLWVLKFLISSFVLTWCPLNSPLFLLPLYIKKIIGMFIN
jgi:hypothetical protein